MRKHALILYCFLLAACSHKHPTSAVNNSQVNADTIISVAKSTVVTDPDHSAGFVALDKYLKQFERPTQHFSIDGDNSRTITGAKGTRINVVPSDLEYADGSKPSGKIDVELIELQNQEDLLRHGVTTTSDGRLLESGGSYYINMRSGGKQLRLKSGRKVAVMFPKKTDRDMQLFYGERDAAGDLNWRATKVAFVPRTDTSAKELTADDFTSERYEVPKYKDTILATMEVRPNHPQKKITEEMRRLYSPVDIRVIDGTPCIVGRVRDTVNRWYAQRKVAGIDKLSEDYYEVMRLNNLGWINVDKFRSDDLITLNAETPVGSEFRAIEAIVVYRNLNACVNRRVYADGQGNVPLVGIAKNQEIKILAMTWQNGGPYAYCRTLRSSPDMKISLDLKPVTKEELARMMAM